MSPLIETLLTTLAVLLSVMIALWGVGTARRDVSLVDIFWGLGFAGVAWLSVSLNANSAVRPRLLALLVSIWGMRLALYILWRNWGHGEDRRYTAMRIHHGRRFWWVSLLTVFLLQGVLLWWISWPLQVTAVNAGPADLQWTDALGLLLWGAGFAFEAIGDWQLARFKSQPENAGRVMDRGLWRYTRHPNYFGEVLIWWGFWCISLAAGGVWTILSPIVMTFLLLKVSGVSLLESTMTDRRPDYADYQRRTSPFLPWPPKS